MTISQAADLVKTYATTDGYRLAMFKVSEDTGYSTSALGREFARRRVESKKKKERKNKVPSWVLEGEEWEL